MNNLCIPPCLFGILVFCLPLNATEPLPNFILMMGDDHGWEETGYHGHPHVRTPILDEIAATGLRLDRFYAGHCNCSPTRGSFLTGRNPNRYGTFAPGWSFRPEEITLGHQLGKAGYLCGHFGKWHVGAVKKGSPTNPGAMGFDTWLSHDNFFELNPFFSRNGGKPEQLNGESSEILVDEVARFIDEATQVDKPFLVVLWFGSPHEPYSGLPGDLALYDDLLNKYTDKKVGVTSNETGKQVKRPRGEVLRERYAEITAMDRAIGKLRKHLELRKVRDNTCLFYCGDNGTSADAALGFPHRGSKSQLYEGGVLVPGLVEWPSRVTSPRTVVGRATTSDLLPTLSHFVDVPLPDRPIDGINIADLIDGKLTTRPAPLFFWDFNTKDIEKSGVEPWIDPALQEGTTPLVKLQGNKATRDFQNYRFKRRGEVDYSGWRTIIDGDHKLSMRSAKPGEDTIELFQLGIDPGEKENLAAQEPELVKVLSSKLRAWQDSVLNSLEGKDYPSVGR